VSAAHAVERLDTLDELSDPTSVVQVIVTSPQHIPEDGRQVGQPIGALAGDSIGRGAEEGSPPDEPGEAPDSQVEVSTVTGEVTAEGREVEATRSGRRPARKGADAERRLPTGKPGGLNATARNATESVVSKVEHLNGTRAVIVEADEQLKGDALSRCGLSGEGGSVDGIAAEDISSFVKDEGGGVVECFGEHVRGVSLSWVRYGYK
jgi:hypothetical protein